MEAEFMRLFNEIIAVIPDVEKYGEHIKGVQAALEELPKEKEKYEELRKEYIALFTEKNSPAKETLEEEYGEPDKEDFGLADLDFNADTE